MDSKTLMQNNLLDAINDYPKQGISTSKELLSELYKKLPPPITLESLLEYSKSIDISVNSWEAESISSLLQLFRGNEKKSLEEIITSTGIK